MTTPGLLLILITGGYFGRCSLASAQTHSGARSFTKMGNLSVDSCDGRGNELFPADVDPYQWRGCGDAYDFTWRNDFNGDITAVSVLDLEKLVRSMGFCPHLRCQTRVNVSNGDANGGCPVGLCYTKLENGALSFGACCFHHGAYNSGGLIGYWHKTQKQAKPIYKSSRVVLGNTASDESYDSFINANRIHPGLIATQAPLSTTVRDAKRMIIEQNITLWIQLAPVRTNASRSLECDHQHNHHHQRAAACVEDGVVNLTKKRNAECLLFPGAYEEKEDGGEVVCDVCPPYKEVVNIDSPVASERGSGADPDSSIKTTLEVELEVDVEGISSETAASHHRHHEPLLEVKSTEEKTAVNANQHQHQHQHRCQLVDKIIVTEIASSSNSDQHHSPSSSFSSSSSCCWHRRKTFLLSFSDANTGQATSWAIDHLWFQRWADFQVPAEETNEEVLWLARRAVAAIEAGATVAVSCKSGRGRTGTFSAIVIGMLEKVSTLSQLADVIVRMREHRDGMVETPAQFRYVARMLGLSSVRGVSGNVTVDSVDSVYSDDSGDNAGSDADAGADSSAETVDTATGTGAAAPEVGSDPGP